MYDEQYGALVMRAPRKVFARMWTPYAQLPFVTEKEIEVAPVESGLGLGLGVGGGGRGMDIMAALNQSIPTEPDAQKEFFQNQFKSPGAFRTVQVGVVDFGDGSTTTVNPRDYVLYHESAKRPVSVITETEFKSQYSANVIDFCDVCTAKLKGIPLTQGTVPLASVIDPQADSAAKLDQLKSILEAGTPIPVTGPGGNPVTLKTVADLNAWAKSMGFSG